MQWDSGSRANIDVSCENVSSHPNPNHPKMQKRNESTQEWIESVTSSKA